MAIDVKRSEGLAPIQIQKRNVPTEQIIAAKGANPIAKGLETAGQLLGVALQRKILLDDQEKKLASIKQAFPEQNIPAGIQDPELALKVIGKQAELKRIEQFGKGSGGGGYFIPRGVDPTTNRPVYSHSKQIGLFYDDMQPFRGPVGALNLKPLTDTSMEKEDAFADLGFTTQKVLDSYADDLVGPAGARIGRGKQYLEGVATPEAANFYSSLSNLKNQIIYLKSGKQINENEFKRLADALPNEYLSPTDFKVRMKNFQDEFSLIFETRHRNLRQSGYRVPAGIENPFRMKPIRKPGAGDAETPEQRKARLKAEYLGAPR